MSVIPQPTLLSWSSGKDSAWSLHMLRGDPNYRVEALCTTFNSNAGRVAMHAVRRELVEAQADRVGLPLWSLDLPWPCSNSVYEDLMKGVCDRALAAGITTMAFGDLFLEDIRAYRETQLKATGIKPVFPVWKIPTSRLACELVDAGVRAKVTCVEPSKLDASFAGRDYDQDFIRDLPRSVDPCGENGEFHTFVYDAPVFSSAISIRGGEIVTRDGFVFADVLPA